MKIKKKWRNLYGNSIGDKTLLKSKSSYFVKNRGDFQFNSPYEIGNKENLNRLYWLKLKKPKSLKFL